MENENFKQYKHDLNDDGTVNVRDVEIFVLGKHKGKDYNDKWWDEAKKNFEEEKKAGHLPGIVFGSAHEKNGAEDPPLRGFIDNLKRKGKILVADLVKIPKEIFEDTLKKRQYPYRSVEILKSKPLIANMALLGKERPYHKLPMMEFGELKEESELENFFFSEDGPYGIIEDFAEVDLEEAIDTEAKLQKVRSVFWKMMDFINNILSDKEKDDATKKKEVKSLINQGTKIISQEAKKFKEENVMNTKFTEEQITAYKEKYGVSPEEAAEALKNFREAEKKRKETDKKAAIKVFCDSLKKDKHIAPVVVDEFIAPLMESINGEVVKFGENEKPALEAFTDMVNKILDLSESQKLIVPFEERTEQGESDDGRKTAFDDNESIDPERLALHKKALSFMEKDANLKYEDAVMRAVGSAK